MPRLATPFALLLGIALTFSSASAATRILSPAQVERADTPTFEVVSADQGGLTLEFQLPALAVEETAVQGRNYQTVTIPNGGWNGEVGQPGIPDFTRLVMIPDGVGVVVSAFSEEASEKSGLTLMPVQSEDGADFALDDQAYARQGYGQDQLATVGAPALLRDLRVVPLTIHPVRYDPARGALEINSRVRVEVRFQGSDPVNTRSLHRSELAPSFDKLYRSLVVNYPGDLKASILKPGTWLVICPDDVAVTSRLQPLMNWRQRKGLPVRLATTAETGTTSTAIKAYIQNAYNTWTAPPEYIVLAGDAAAPYSIPTFAETLSGYGGPGDHPYTQLAGNDLLADVHLGRLSFSNTTELETIVAKIVGYETAPDTTDSSWYGRACLVGDPTDSGPSTVQVQQWIKTRLLKMGYSQIDTIFGAPFASQMATDLNRGDTIFCYRGFYGFSGWTNSNTYALTNGWKMPFALMCTCGTGSFVSSTSNSEAFLRAGTSTTPKGAVGAVGTATTGTHTRFNNCYTFGVFQGLLYEGLYEEGAAHTRGKLELYLEYNGTSQSRYATIFSYWNNLMGDPACETWTGVPQTFSVGFPASVPVGQNSIGVSVAEGSSPSDGATVCLSKGSETFVVGQTGPDGTCELPVSLLTAGDLLVTVSKHNFQSYRSQITVSSPTLFVGYQSSTVDDDNSGTSSGNGDGVINPGESIQLPVQLENFGSGPAGGVSAVLSSTDPYVTITESSMSFGDIAGASSAWSAGDFDLHVDLGCPQGHVLRFALDVTSGENSWHSIIEKTVAAAAFNATGATFYGAGSNNLLDPAETVGLSLPLKNVGGLAASGATAILRSESPFLIVSDSTGTYGAIPVGGTAENTGDRFTVTADAGAYAGGLVSCKLIITSAGGARDTALVVLTIGSRASSDPTGPDAYGYYAFDNTDAAYGELPSYNWLEIDPAYGGTGTAIPLNDTGDSRDKTLGVDLPFAFGFYGHSFTRASVCSNGWLAMGETQLTDFRNWSIPGAGAPNNLLAVEWDDLYSAGLGAGQGQVYQKYDEANHLWIVEWSRMRSMTDNSVQTFEAILYDPAYATTYTGDGQIKYQYASYSNTDTEDGYCTVGIQNYDHTVGLLYSYFNAYSPGSAALGAGRAILFLPVAAAATGSLRGSVSDASLGNAPLSSARITLLENGRNYTSGADGHYAGATAPGTYTFVASLAGFQPDTVRDVAVAASQVTTVDFSLVDTSGPNFDSLMQVASTASTSGPYLVNATMHDGSGISAATLYYRVGGDWTAVPMSAISSGVYQGSIPGMPYGSQIDYYVEATDGVLHSTVEPSGAPASFSTFYITQIQYSSDCEDPGDSNWQMRMPGDTATSGFWVRVDPIGTIYGGQQMQPETSHSPTMCYVTGQGPVGGQPNDADVDGGCTSLRSPIFDLSSAARAYVRYWRWFAKDGTSLEDVFRVDVSGDGGTTWANLETVSLSRNTWTSCSFDLSQFITLTDRVTLRFVACDLGTTGLVEAAVDDFSLETFPSDPTSAPPAQTGPDFLLAPSRPNPFSQRTAIEFAQPSAGFLTLGVYDVQGRLVRMLRQGNQPAGRQMVSWDGTDEAGTRVPSGLYFYRLHAGSRHQLQKLIRLD